ncbi:MAG: hypothetical protein ABFD92_18735 [Planctomycetaceae bacterium]|nr:hypothetical protein [Planctomycetaceae bacterium]
MKSKLIILLVCLNVILLAAVIWGPTQPSQAQESFRTTDYQMYTTRIGIASEGLIVVDLAKRSMRAWSLAAPRGGRYQMIMLRGTRDLNVDYRRGAAQ